MLRFDRNTEPANASMKALQEIFKGEIISRSSIGKEFIWPEVDPRLQQQPVRNYTIADKERNKRLSISREFNMTDFLKQTQALDISSRIIELLNHRAFQFNSRKRFRECVKWREQVSDACKKGTPIEILILAFCVISNPTKRVQSTEVTVAEDVSLLYMNYIANLISEIYPPGAVFYVISDSTFYTLPLRVTSVEAQNYLFQLRKRVEDLHIVDTVKILDITDYLSYYNQFFHKRFEVWRAKFLDNPLGDGLSSEEYCRWHNSMSATLNSRRMGFSYEQLKTVFSFDSNFSINEFHEDVTLALAEYRALKSAAADTNWELNNFPNAIRATIHAKKIPVLGLRLYPEYKKRSRLLPYHGIAVVFPGEKKDEEYMEIRHEITLIGNPEFTKVVDNNNVTQFYELS